MAKTLFPETIAELLSRGYRVRFKAEGKSMQPTIRDGESITVQPMEPSDVKRGDIILYRSGGAVIAHRVEEIAWNGSRIAFFILRGDASSSPDQPVRPERVLGRVVSVERENQHIALGGKEARIRYTLRSHFRRLMSWRICLPLF